MTKRLAVFDAQGNLTLAAKFEQHLAHLQKVRDSLD